MVDVYLNSKFIGMVEDPRTFVESIKDLRRGGALSENVNVYWDTEAQEVNILTDEGRSRRPLIVVREGSPLLTERHLKQLTEGEITWQDLIRQGIIEYLDAAEEENALVAYDETMITPEHTHLEVTPGSISGITPALVPFGNYNQSSRLIIGSKNQKQALGFYAANYHLRMDMDANVLHYPQFPIVKTKIHDI